MRMTVSGGGAVEDLFRDYQGLIDDLSYAKSSALTALNRSYHKHLLVAAASSLEYEVKNFLLGAYETRSPGQLRSFVEKNVVARGYHNLFDWKEGVATKFFQSFGEECKDRFKALLKNDASFKEHHDAFMQLGAYRNDLVHNNYAMRPVDMSPEDVIAAYRKALMFVNRLEGIVFPPEGD